jgi:hypothetical protein
MKSEIFSFIVLITAITAVGCNNNKVEVKEKQPALVESTFDIDERLKGADSLVVVFYKDPYGTDSVRYTRFYTQISVVEASSLELLQQQLAEKVIKEEQYRKCRGEGKIWCFSNGKIFQTLYFSTRCDKCCHVFIIRDGFYYYSSISPTFVKWLTSIKPLTKEPANEAQKNNN